MKSYKYKPYYIIRPRTWKENIKHIDPRTAISREWRYAYIRIPKSGNSTVIYNIQENFPDKHIMSKKIDTIKNNYIHFSDLSYFESLFLMRNIFIFTIVRNPYHRILSAYIDKISNKNTPQYRRYHNDILYFDNGNISFKGFCRYLAGGGEYQNAHWMSQSRILQITDRIDYIGKVENLEKDLTVIMKQISPDIRIKIERKGSQNKSSDLMYSYYDDECYDIVKSIYKNDFNDFDYM